MYIYFRYIYTYYGELAQESMQAGRPRGLLLAKVEPQGS